MLPHRGDGAKNGMVFKVGAVDCSGREAMKFCRTKLGPDGKVVPAFATVLNGSVDVVADRDRDALRTAKKLHDHTTATLLQLEGLVVAVDTAQHIQSRLFASSPANPGQPNVAVVLFTDKGETSPLYASLAYRHHEMQAPPGRLRGVRGEPGGGPGAGRAVRGDVVPDAGRAGQGRGEGST